MALIFSHNKDTNNDAVRVMAIPERLIENRGKNEKIKFKLYT